MREFPSRATNDQYAVEVRGVLARSECATLIELTEVSPAFRRSVEFPKRGARVGARLRARAPQRRRRHPDPAHGAAQERPAHRRRRAARARHLRPRPRRPARATRRVAPRRPQRAPAVPQVVRRSYFFSWWSARRDVDVKLQVRRRRLLPAALRRLLPPPGHRRAVLLHAPPLPERRLPRRLDDVPQRRGRPLPVFFSFLTAAHRAPVGGDARDAAPRHGPHPRPQDLPRVAGGQGRPQVRRPHGRHVSSRRRLLSLARAPATRAPDRYEHTL